MHEQETTTDHLLLHWHRIIRQRKGQFLDGVC